MNAFDIEHADDAFMLDIPRGDKSRSKSHGIWLCVLSIVSALTLAIAVAALVASLSVQRIIPNTAAPPVITPTPPLQQSSGQGVGVPAFVPFSRLAFGSCTAYDEREQPVWTQGVVPYRPDAWLWVGDMAYADSVSVSCTAAPELAACRCNATWLRHAPTECMAGDTDHARDRFMAQISIPEYRQFLQYMCPGSEAAGLFPPPGTDPAVCPRPILGVYDDHDSGWNNGNARLPQKHIMKNIYLDAVGELRSSPRRNYNTGLQWRYTLNQGVAGREVDVILLDERYYRDTVPCAMRREWCTGVLQSEPPTSSEYVWCADFLVDDGATGRGSCCAKDEAIAGWCAQHGNHSMWSSACDATSSAFGMAQLVLMPDNETLVEVTAGTWERQSEVWRQLVQGSPFCDVLGLQQRKWLRDVLATSAAALKIVASGSVLVGSLGYVDPRLGRCSSDDWECWKPAQLNLLHTLSNASTGCVVVATGDYHYGDIKAVMPDSSQAYGSGLHSGSLSKPVYQIMASGLTNSTAASQGQPCDGSYREDLVGLRPLGSCAYVPQPHFGAIEVDWDAQTVTLSIRDAANGSVAADYTGAMLTQFTFSLRDCSSTAA